MSETVGDPLTLIDPQPALLLAAVAVVAVTVLVGLLHVARSRPRRPDEGPTTMDLGAEPPAIVDLLTDDFEVTPQAVPATLLDLAARDVLTIEEVQPDRPVVRLRSSAPRVAGGSLTDYEQRVLSHVEGLAVDGVVPTEALTTGPAAESRQWWDAFRSEVISDAQRRGLCRRRWPRPLLTALGAGALSSGGLLYLSARLGDEQPIEGTSLPAPFVVLVATAAAAVMILVATADVARRDRQRDTDEGLAAASRWLGVRRHLAEQGDFEGKPAASVTLWDRYLGCAVALGLAPLAVAQLPLGAEDDRHAWSRAGGRWRAVTVRYPRLRPAWGMHPALAIFRSILLGAPAALAARILARLAADPPDSGPDALLDAEAARWLARGALAFAVLAGVVAAWAAVALVVAVADIGRRRRVVGLVLRVRPGRGERGLEVLAGSFGKGGPTGSAEGERPRLVYVALDTGRGDRCTAWLVDAGVAAAVRQGDTAWAHVTPRLGHVSRFEPGPAGAC